jgi:sugar phosphate isomerase/epimerase
MRLGGPVFLKQHDPQSWVAALKDTGYRAAYCPVDADAGSDVIQAYAAAARQAGIIIAEVGAWSNPLSPDEEECRNAVRYCQEQLALAEEIGALCCVNIAGSCGERWDGPHPDNFTQAAFDRIVEVVREIIDAVRPRRTYYTLEAMPWMYPDSPDRYLELLQAVDRARFAVHLDPVNMICSPQRYFGNAEFLRECFEKLGPYIKSVHAKDILLSDRLTTHLDEVRPGLGYLDYRTFLHQMDRLTSDAPIMLEHMQEEEEYRLAAKYIRSIASEVGAML